jgi:WD40 repeat protein
MKFHRCGRFIHGVIGLVAHVPAHEKAIKSIAMLSMGDGPRLLSGSEDGLIKVIIYYTANEMRCRLEISTSTYILMMVIKFITGYNNNNNN